MNEMGEVKAGSGNTQLERPVMGPVGTTCDGSRSGLDGICVWMDWSHFGCSWV